MVMTKESLSCSWRAAAPSRELSRRLMLGIVVALAAGSAAPRIEPSQALRWQTVTMTFEGPEASEGGAPNPFLDYRMSVRFTHEASGYEAASAGFFAADGNAAESSAKSGNKWRVRFGRADQEVRRRPLNPRAAAAALPGQA